MRRADRLFQIVLMLGRGKVLTAQALGERLEVSERTVYRDVQDLMASGVPIEGEAGVGYCLRSGYQVPPMMFDEDELQALMFGADVARSYGDPAMAAAADRILAKVDAVLPERLRPRLAASALFVPDFRVSEKVAETLGEARTAINSRRRMFIDYETGEGESSERIIWPLALSYWGRVWTLGGWCELRQDFRNFRLDRIKQLQILGSSFDDMPGRRLTDYVAAVSGPR
jgi:predicted DNA-binding transcriptional regulator YafY